jgi:hypothetical protein
MPQKVADGWNNAGSLVNLIDDDFVDAPPNLHYPEHRRLANGHLKAVGAMVEVLEFTNLETATYLAILAKWGFSTAIDDVSNEITYQTVLPDRATAVNYNAWVVHRKGIDAPFENGRYTFARFEVTIKEAL